MNEDNFIFRDGEAIVDSTFEQEPSYIEFSFPSLYRDDVYDNEYFLSEDESLVEVRPDLEPSEQPDKRDEYRNWFKDYMRNIFAFQHNFRKLASEGVKTPESAIGIDYSDGRPEPYFLMENIEGEPLSEVEELLDERELLSQQFQEYNQIGKRLGEWDSIAYDEYRKNEDLIVTNLGGIEETELVYENPGRYSEAKAEIAFNKSDFLPDRRTIGKWVGPSYWERKFEEER